MTCPVCRATSDDAHKLDCPHSGKGPTVPASFDGGTFELRLGVSARMQCDVPRVLDPVIEAAAIKAYNRYVRGRRGAREWVWAGPATRELWRAIVAEVLGKVPPLEPIRAVVP